MFQCNMYINQLFIFKSTIIVVFKTGLTNNDNCDLWYVYK